MGVTGFEMSHVSGPNLIAMAMGHIGVTRNGEEELIARDFPTRLQFADRQTLDISFLI